MQELTEQNSLKYLVKIQNLRLSENRPIENLNEIFFNIDDVGGIFIA